MEQIVEKGVEVTQVIVEQVEDSNTLTAVQKEVLSNVFNDVKDTAQLLMADTEISNQIKIMKLVSRIIKTVQDLSAMKPALTGVDKKVIALECGRKCIKMMKDHLDILMMYDLIAEPALETMLDLSRKLKPVKIEELTKAEPSVECCMGLFSSCMSIANK